MSDRITHEGIIDHIENDTIFVRILSESACSACHSKTMCSVSEMIEKLVEVKGGASSYTAGQSVTVILDRTLGNKAVFLGYLLPFILMFVTLIIASSFLAELWAGLLAIAILIPYYFSLFIFKKSLSRAFTFRIEPI